MPTIPERKSELNKKSNYKNGIPKPNHNFVYFGLNFGLVFEADPASKTNQKQTKNKPKTYQHFRTICTRLYGTVQAVFIDFWYVVGSFLVRFWFIFNASSASKTKPKSNQNKRTCGLFLNHFLQESCQGPRVQ